jgi:hypothetical protein
MVAMFAINVNGSLSLAAQVLLWLVKLSLSFDFRHAFQNKSIFPDYLKLSDAVWH